jgi:hypothetical protein
MFTTHPRASFAQLRRDIHTIECTFSEGGCQGPGLGQSLRSVPKSDRKPCCGAPPVLFATTEDRGANFFVSFFIYLRTVQLK